MLEFEYRFKNKYLCYCRIKIRDWINSLIADGAGLEQVMVVRPISEWDKMKGYPANFLSRS